jgi:hypothetical protein
MALPTRLGWGPDALGKREWQNDDGFEGLSASAIVGESAGVAKKLE